MQNESNKGVEHHTRKCFFISCNNYGSDAFVFIIFGESLIEFGEKGSAESIERLGTI